HRGDGGEEKRHEQRGCPDPDLEPRVRPPPVGEELTPRPDPPAPEREAAHVRGQHRADRERRRAEDEAEEARPPDLVHEPGGARHEEGDREATQHPRADRRVPALGALLLELGPAPLAARRRGPGGRRPHGARIPTTSPTSASTLPAIAAASPVVTQSPSV